jgi:PTS system mannose-specific IID component
MADKTENKIRLSKRDRWDVCWRSTFIQGIMEL